jgi:hypothetical protein
MPRKDRLGITLSLVLLGLALSMLVSLPSRVLTLVVLGSELTVPFSGAMQFSLILAAMVCAGVDAIVRSHPRLHDHSIAYTVTFWVLPSLITVASLALLSVLPWWGYQIGLIGLTGALLALVIVSQYRSLDAADPHFQGARLMLNAVSYIAALVLFSILYGTRQRSVISATGVLVAAGMLALELLRSFEGRPRRTWFYAALTGLMMGELTWALNYNSLDARLGGTVLLLTFYTLTGLMQQHFWGRLTRRTVLEYGVVCALGATIITAFARWLQR